MTLQNFPRGGEKRKSISTTQLFHKNIVHKKTAKNKNKKKSIKAPDTELNFTAHVAERLSNATLCEGLIVLGRICEVREYDLIVSLPGGLNGQLRVTDISKSYTDLLQNIIKTEEDSLNEFKPVSELYNVGEYIVCYVKSTQAEGKWNISLSLEPHLVNKNIDINYLTNGLRLPCSVSSIEDHGYVVETGIPNARAFISNKDVDMNKKYFAGKQLFCVIKEIKTTNNVSIINLSAKQKLVGKVTNVQDVQSLDILMPGTRIQLYIKKILSNGLQVTYGENNIGYINQIYLDKTLSFYTEDTMINGTLMYIVPTVKFAYFSLIANKPEGQAQNENLSRGDIVEKAIVLFRESNGIVLRLGPGLRGFVSFYRTGIDFDNIAAKFTPNSTHKCRVLFYNWMEKIYICTMQRDELQEKHFTGSDISIGDILNVRVARINTEKKCVTVNIGKISGIVPTEHISDSSPDAINKLKVGQTMKARVLHIDENKNKILFTLKESLIKSNLPILFDIHDAECDSKHHGTIVQINKNGLLVRFFGEVRGWLPCIYLDKNTASVNWNYSIGQTIATFIESVDKNEGKMKLNLISNIIDKKKSEFTIGENVEGTVIDASMEGIHLEIKDKDGYSQKGFLPAGHIAPCIEVARLLASKYVPGDAISALVFANEPTLILSRTFLSNEKHRQFKQLQIGDSIPTSIKDITHDGVRVLLPIEHYKKYGFIPFNKITNFDMIYTNQILFAKITNINKKEEQLHLTMSLEKIWMEEDESVKIMSSIDLLSLYFNKIKELKSNHYYKNRPISTVRIGQMVHGTIDKITNHGLILKLENNLQGIVHKKHYNGIRKVGDKISGKIMWINYLHELVDVTLLPIVVNNISSNENIKLPTETCLRGDIIMITQWFILVVLKGKGKGMIVALPARRHVNDLQPDLRPYTFFSRIRCFVALNKNESDILPICVLKSVFEVSKKAAVSKVMHTHQTTVKGTPELIKINEVDETPELEKMKNHSKKDASHVDDIEQLQKNQLPKKRKIEDETSTHESKKSKKKTQNLNPVNNDKSNNECELKNKKHAKDTTNALSIPQCGFYWDTIPDSKLATKIQTSSDSEDDIEEHKKSKIKKLSAAQRREQERQKEREIREREEALASNQMPNTVDQFDRLVLTSPDSSLVWLQYMAYHLQATEIEKARAVARRAIKTINFREENEKLNVWNAWLNLESKFGTPETLNDVYQEAIRTNDALKIHTHMLTVHVEAGRQIELEKLVNTFIRKFKQNPQVWIDCGAALLKLGLKDKSRQTMQRALQSLPSSDHVNIMVRFANLENQFGDKERSQTLFEQILSSYPKRVDVWSSYVDSLVKSQEIHIARKVLERGVVQNLPPKKMKTLFKKFISFEEKHGTPTDVEHVQRMAADYIENQCSENVN